YQTTTLPALQDDDDPYMASWKKNETIINFYRTESKEIGISFKKHLRGPFEIKYLDHYINPPQSFHGRPLDCAASGARPPIRLASGRSA
ncbi:MAG: hypothetical protein LBU23_13500, partial [Planctomycetota bacterium]|nr:hypothetical protein [Planctomycetota bacterium]